MNRVLLLSVSLAAVVLLGLGGFLIHKYGSAKYAEGKSNCEAAQLQVAADTANKDRAAFDRIQGRKIDDLDRAGAALGIMRPDEDR